MDIRQKLPAQIKRRFDSIGSFVNSIVDTIEEKEAVPKKRRLPASSKSDIALLVFIFSLHHFLQEGSRAAGSAAKLLPKKAYDRPRTSVPASPAPTLSAISAGVN